MNAFFSGITEVDSAIASTIVTGLRKIFFRGLGLSEPPIKSLIFIKNKELTPQILALITSKHFLQKNI